MGIKHKFVYGSSDSKKDIDTIISYCKAAGLKNYLNMTTAGVFGGRGMGQTCGVADPSQWMRVFGVDIDSRDTTQLIELAKSISDSQISEFLPRLKELFGEVPDLDEVAQDQSGCILPSKKYSRRKALIFIPFSHFPGWQTTMLPLVLLKA
ncbi:MAG: hypothetical protein U5N58_07140 [Actinomycetota bacterium]|nr:hypothetical protein [Actinomycetota bacterium]